MAAFEIKFQHPVSRVLRVVDGDTQDILLDLGYRTFQKVTTRLVGIDAPELNTAAGKAVRDAVAAQLQLWQLGDLRWCSYSLDMYGRSLGDFRLLGFDNSVDQWLCAWLVANKLARPMPDGKRAPWSGDELAAAAAAAAAVQQVTQIL